MVSVEMNNDSLKYPILQMKIKTAKIMSIISWDLRNIYFYQYFLQKYRKFYIFRKTGHVKSGIPYEFHPVSHGTGPDRTGKKDKIFEKYRTGQNLIRSGTGYRIWPFYPVRSGPVPYATMVVTGNVHILPRSDTGAGSKGFWLFITITQGPFVND